MDESSESKILFEEDKPHDRQRMSQGQKDPFVVLSQTDKIPLRYYKDVIWSSRRAISLFIILGIGIALLITKLVPPTYVATTIITVSKANLQQSPNYDTILISENLARTYAETITSKKILDQVKPLLNSDINVGELSRAITANHVSDTQRIEIDVEYTDPLLAVKIANTLVEVFSSQVTKDQSEYATYQDNGIETRLQEAQSEIARLQGKINEESNQRYNQKTNLIESTIADLQKQIEQIIKEIAPLQIKSHLTTVEQIELSNKLMRKDALSAQLVRYQDELVALNISGPTYDPQDFVASQDYALLDQYQRTYLGLMQTQQNLVIDRLQDMVKVTQVGEPAIPENPIRPNMKINVVLGFMAGLLMATIYIFITKLGRL